jgi:hypothetical protein
VKAKSINSTLTGPRDGPSVCPWAMDTAGKAKIKIADKNFFMTLNKAAKLKPYLNI